MDTRLPAPQPPLPLSPLGLAAAPRMDQTPAARAEARSQATDRRCNTDAADPVPNMGQQLPPAGLRPCERPPPSRAAAGGRRGAAMSATLPEKPEGAASAPPSEFLSRVPSRRQSPAGRSRALPQRRQRRRDPEGRPSPSARRAAQKPRHCGPASQPACPPARPGPRPRPQLYTRAARGYAPRGPAYLTPLPRPPALQVSPPRHGPGPLRGPHAAPPFARLCPAPRAPG